MGSRDSVTRVESFTEICSQPSNWLATEIKVGKAIFVMRGAHETLLGKFRTNMQRAEGHSFSLGHIPPTHCSATASWGLRTDTSGALLRSSR